MYIADNLMYEHFSHQEYNNFQFWREPIMELNLDEFDVCDVKAKVTTKVAPVSLQYDSFLYWRDPIPEFEIPDLDEI